MLPLIMLVASLGSLFLCVWIVIPAPTARLLPLSVGAPEISPWLLATQGLVLSITLWISRGESGLGWPQRLTLLASLIGVSLSLLPLVQLPETHQQATLAMQTALGQDYLARIPADLQQRFRHRPLIWVDAFRGISPSSVAVQQDIVFAQPDGVPLTLTVYGPSLPGSHPTLVVVYGGAWRSGSPNDYKSLGRYLAGQGYTVVALDYRHAPRYHFPIQLQDVQTALTYIRDHAADLAIDLTRVAIMGRSAGAQLAAIATYDTSPLPLRAVINYYGPVDLRAGYERPPIPDPIDTRAVLEDFLGGSPQQVPHLYHQASPIHYLRPELPPTLLVYAGRDHIVQPSYGQDLYQELKATGNRVVWLCIPWADHAFDTVFHGVSNQLALYHTERFLAWALYANEPPVR